MSASQDEVQKAILAALLKLNEKVEGLQTEVTQLKEGRPAAALTQTAQQPVNTKSAAEALFSLIKGGKWPHYASLREAYDLEGTTSKK